MNEQTDRELLEMAARAAEITWYGIFGDDKNPCLWFDIGEEDVIAWNPLDSDADALRLASDLELDVMYRVVGGTRVEILPPGGPLTVEFYETLEERLPATRRCIVRAAASMGGEK